MTTLSLKGILFCLAVCMAVILHAGAAVSGQPWPFPPACQKGGDEAEALFNEALSYENGILGKQLDAAKARRLYEKSLELGNPKAAITLGTLLRTVFANDAETREALLQEANALYQKAIDMGCPEGYFYLAQSYENGWGVPKDQKKQETLRNKGMEAGSVFSLAACGKGLCETGEIKKGVAFMEKALEQGFSPIAYELSFTYLSLRDHKKMIETLRKGAKLGFADCLYVLAQAYSDNFFALQTTDEEYSNCFMKLYKEVYLTGTPKPIDLDRICPPRHVERPVPRRVS